MILRRTSEGFTGTMHTFEYCHKGFVGGRPRPGPVMAEDDDDDTRQAVLPSMLATYTCNSSLTKTCSGLHLIIKISYRFLFIISASQATIFSVSLIT